MRRKFSNHRQWHEFIAAVHESVTQPCAVTYPKVIGALRSGRDWFSGEAARATSWLRGPADPHTTLDVALNLERIKA